MTSHVVERAIEELAPLAQPVREPPALLREAMDLIRTAAELVHDDLRGSVGTLTERLMSPGQALAHIVHGGSDAYATALGVPIEQSRLVVILSSAPQMIALSHRLANSSPRAVVSVFEHETVILFPGVPRANGQDPAGRESTRLVRYLRRHLIDGWTAGVSATVTVPAQLAPAYRDARDAAALAARDGAAVLAVDDAWARLAVARLQRSMSRVGITNSPVDTLAEYDAAHHTSLAETVGVWLAVNGDTQTAARHLCVHPNTLRYRLKRAADLARIDLSDPHQRIILQLAYLT